MGDDDEVVACAAACVLVYGQILLDKTGKKIRKRRCWVSSAFRGRDEYNATHLLEDLSQEPVCQYENFCRMTAIDFELLLQKIGRFIQKSDTSMRKAISPKERLAVTLRYLTTGDSFKSLTTMFKFSSASISSAVEGVCHALIQELGDQIKTPKSCHDWKSRAEEYGARWNFPHCLGALEARFVIIQPLAFVSQRTHPERLVVTAIADANYFFTFADVGFETAANDCFDFRSSPLFDKMKSGELMLPPEASTEQLHLDLQVPLPYVFIAGECFPLHKYLMRPYPGVGTRDKGIAKSVFNRRIAHARKSAENALGVMASVFGVLRKPIALQVRKVKVVAIAAFVLHNFLRGSESSRDTYSPPEMFDREEEEDGELFTPGLWRDGLKEYTSFLPVQDPPKGGQSNEAKKIRNSFAEYFKSRSSTI